MYKLKPLALFLFVSVFVVLNVIWPTAFPTANSKGWGAPIEEPNTSTSRSAKSEPAPIELEITGASQNFLDANSDYIIYTRVKNLSDKAQEVQSLQVNLTNRSPNTISQAWDWLALRTDLVKTRVATHENIHLSPGETQNIGFVIPKNLQKYFIPKQSRRFSASSASAWGARGLEITAIASQTLSKNSNDSAHTVKVSDRSFLTISPDPTLFSAKESDFSPIRLSVSIPLLPELVENNSTETSQNSGHRSSDTAPKPNSDSISKDISAESTFFTTDPVAALQAPKFTNNVPNSPFITFIHDPNLVFPKSITPQEDQTHTVYLPQANIDISALAAAGQTEIIQQAFSHSLTATPAFPVTALLQGTLDQKALIAVAKSSTAPLGVICQSLNAPVQTSTSGKSSAESAKKEISQKTNSSNYEQHSIATSTASCPTETRVDVAIPSKILAINPIPKQNSLDKNQPSYPNQEKSKEQNQNQYSSTPLEEDSDRKVPETNEYNEYDSDVASSQGKDNDDESDFSNTKPLAVVSSNSNFSQVLKGEITLRKTQSNPSEIYPLTAWDQQQLFLAQLAIYQQHNPKQPLLVMSAPNTFPNPAIQAAIKVLQDAPWAKGVSLIDIFSLPAAETLNLSQVSENFAAAASLDPTQLALLHISLQSAKSFSSISPLQNQLLEPLEKEFSAIISQSSNSDPKLREKAYKNFADNSMRFSRAVNVISSSQINVLSTSANLPVHVRNDFPAPISVTVAVVSDDPVLQVLDKPHVVVPPKSSQLVTVPVTAVGNGTVNLRVNIENDQGLAVNQSSTLTVHVKAQWEGLGIIVIGALLLAGILYGFVKNIRRGKRFQKDSQSQTK